MSATFAALTMGALHFDSAVCNYNKGSRSLSKNDWWTVDVYRAILLDQIAGNINVATRVNGVQIN